MLNMTPNLHDSAEVKAGKRAARQAHFAAKRSNLGPTEREQLVEQAYIDGLCAHRHQTAEQAWLTDLGVTS